MKIILLLLSLFLSGSLFSQSRNFEGIITYRVTVKPKQEGVTEKTMKTILATGDIMTDYIKQGNYRQSTTACETYFIPKDQKVYLKFKNLDTLYYLDYNSDTAAVTNISRQPEQKNIAGFICTAITLKNAATSRKYFYSPTLHINPEYDKENLLSNYNVYVKETESVWLASQEDAENYTLSNTATKVEQKPIDDNVFNLPKLPQKKLELESVLQQPEFSKVGGWINYLQKNTNSAIGATYIKIPKGESGATQIPVVAFMVSETGQVLNAKVENRKEVHPKVAEEAIRVVMESRGWKPATIYGEKISFWLKQPITFQVAK